MDLTKKINKVYTDASNPGGFSSLNALYLSVKKKHPEITKDDVKKFLQSNRTYTLFKDRKIKFPRSSIVPTGVLEQLHCDLADFQMLSRKNQGYRYMLVAVDIFTKMAYAAPVKAKTFKEMKEGFDKIFDQMQHLPSSIFTDRGLEFVSKEMKAYLENQGVMLHKAIASHIKASIAERMIKTIKHRLYRYFSEVFIYIFLFYVFMFRRTPQTGLMYLMTL
jgi:hypothetical protein